MKHNSPERKYLNEKKLDGLTKPIHETKGDMEQSPDLIFIMLQFT